MSRWRGIVVASLLTLAVPAAAQDPAAKPPGPERDGFLIGFSLGFGASYPCDECPGFGGSFMVGGMAAKNVAVLIEFASVSSERDGLTAGLGLITIGARYWPHRKVWVQGGFGLGYPVDDFEDDETNTEWGAMVGAGYEIVQRGRFAFDVGVRGGFGGDRQSFTLTLGFNWY